jgi:hypothetical protein
MVSSTSAVAALSTRNHGARMADGVADDAQNRIIDFAGQAALGQPVADAQNRECAEEQPADQAKRAQRGPGRGHWSRWRRQR